jgi:hypothetical protein
MGFRNNNFLQGWIVSPAPNLEDQVSVFMTPGDRVAQLYPQVLGTILVAFYDMHGLQWDYSLIPATTRHSGGEQMHTFYYYHISFQDPVALLSLLPHKLVRPPYCYHGL